MMARRLPIVDVDEATDLGGTVAEVRRSGIPRLVRLRGEDAALLVPLPKDVKRKKGNPREERPTPEEVERSRAGIEAAAGAWKDIDAEALKQELRRQRDVSTRPPVDL
jgi:hypothetical protein